MSLTILIPAKNEQLSIGKTIENLIKSKIKEINYEIILINDFSTDKTVKINYSRPQLKGRSVSDLAPAGKVWRTGANEAPEITFYKDVTLGGKSVKAGTYSLLTIPGNDEWTVILSSDINVWGAYSYDEKNDVARVSGKVSQGESLEAFSITFDDDGNMHMGWGTVRIMVPMG